MEELLFEMRLADLLSSASNEEQKSGITHNNEESNTITRATTIGMVQAYTFMDYSNSD